MLFMLYVNAVIKYKIANSIPSLHWGLTWDSIAAAWTQCIAAFESEETFV